MPAAQYPFDAAFQRRLVSAVLRDAAFMKTYGAVVAADYFTSEHCRQAMAIVEEHFAQWGEAPGEVAFRELVRAEFAKHPPSREARRGWDEFFEQLWQENPRDTRYVEERAVRWAQEQAWRRLVEDGARRIEEGRRTGVADFGDFQQKLEEARSVGLPSLDQPLTDYLETAPRRMAMYHDLGKDKIPTMMLKLDRHLSGGLERGELGVVAAPTSRGKTAALVQLACVGGMLAGQRILAVTLELSSFNFQKRIDKCVSLMREAEIRDDPGQLFDRLEFLKRFRPDLKVLEFPALSCGVSDVEKRLDQYRSGLGWIPTMLVLDYATIVKPEKTKGDRERRNEIEWTILRLRALARTHKLAVWTAAQTNRGSFKKEIITTADIGECIGISQHCDVMLTICQTDAEELEDRCRFFVAKNREGEAKKMIHLEYDKHVNRFTQVERPVEDAKIEKGKGK